MIDFKDKSPRDIRAFINDHAQKHGLSTPLPSFLIVDAATYGRCCQEIFNWMREDKSRNRRLRLGLNNGLMFKDIELILEDK